MTQEYYKKIDLGYTHWDISPEDIIYDETNSLECGWSIDDTFEVYSAYVEATSSPEEFREFVKFFLEMAAESK